MSTDALTPFAYVVLVLVGSGGASAHDLVRMNREGPIYWASADSQLYAEPKRLAALGYLDAERQPGKTRERTVYTLTERGREALRSWMEEPSAFSRLQLEPAIRLLAADLVGDVEVLRSLDGLRPVLDDLGRRLDAAEARAADLPHRARVLGLNHRLARAILEAHRDWLDEVDRELG